MPSYEMAVLEGAVSVQAVLEARFRRIHEILVADDVNQPRIARILRLARRDRITVRSTPRKEIARLATGASHGGILAVAGPRRYQSLPGVLAGAPHAGSRPFLAMLDGIEDPYNFGQAIRALYAAGADGLLLREGHRPSADAVVARASAGASERIPTVLVPDPEVLLADLRSQRIRVVCTQVAATGSHALSCHDADLTGPLLLVIGGERRGIGRSLAAGSDLLVTIPYGRRFPAALDATSATAALAFEVARQRRLPGRANRTSRHQGARAMDSRT